MRIDSGMISRVLLLLLFLGMVADAQDTIAGKSVFSLSGYLKDLQWAYIDKQFSEATTTNLIHNRLNLKYEQGLHFAGRLELRNRLFMGDDVSTIPDFTEQLDDRNELVKLSFSSQSGDVVFHSNVERLWLSYSQEKWNVRVGRQRVNWGMTNTWNPNDIFNSYNFLDFDYEERAGADAVKVQYKTNGWSGFEMAASGNQDFSIAALKYYTNYRNYDLQWSAGVYDRAFTAGFGWAGSILNAGFKGEAQYFAATPDSADQLNLSLESDYIFKSGLYLSVAVLYNQRGYTEPMLMVPSIRFEVSPRQLMPARWNVLVTAAKELNSRFSGNMSVVYMPGIKMMILYPALKYNLNQNLDIDLVWQSYLAETDKFEVLSHFVLARLKWSF